MLSGVRLADLDDFLLPAQDCIVELLKPVTTEEDTSDVRRRIPRPVEDKSELIKTDESYEGAKVSLYDCLACSGCVTTSEVVLMEEHSTSRLFDVLGERGRQVAVGIQAQSLAALSEYLGLGGMDDKVLRALQLLLAEKGVVHVSSTNAADAYLISEMEEHIATGKMVTSHCPGWVCYAEKTVNPEKLSRIWTRPSSMIISAIWTRRGLMNKHVKRASGRIFSPLDFMSVTIDIFYVAVQPCYDKKLEAVRKEFNPGDSPIVDLVLGANEFIEVLLKLNISEKEVRQTVRRLLCENVYDDPFAGARETPMTFAYPIAEVPAEAPFPTGRSGNFAAAAADSASVERIVNSDFFVIKGKRSRALLAYGFRNLFNFTQENDATLPSVSEVMACPSGCVMGGAHGPLLGSGVRKAAEFKQRLDEAFRSLGCPWREHAVFSCIREADAEGIPEFEFRSLVAEKAAGAVLPSDLNW